MPSDDYAAFKQYWATLPAPLTASDILANLDQINSRTITGPRVDVPISRVLGYLALNSKLTALQIYANSADSLKTKGGLAAKEFMTLLSIQGFLFEMSKPSVYAAVEGFLDALVADTNTTINSADKDALLALSAGPTLSWHNSPVALGGADVGAAYVNGWDLYNTGLVTAELADATELLRQQRA